MKVDKELGFGFIKKNLVRLCMVQYCFEEGLRFYYIFVLGEDIFFWDVIGRVVKQVRMVNDYFIMNLC